MAVAKNGLVLNGTSGKVRHHLEYWLARLDIVGGVGRHASDSAPYGTYLMTKGARVLTDVARLSVRVSLIPYQPHTT